MAKGRVRIAVVGVGGMGAAHLRFLKEIAEAETVAVVDTDAAMAARRGAEFGLPGFGSIAAMAAATAPHAVSIATPHPAHLPAALEAFRLGLHVFCEKPLCSLTSEADRMIAAARKGRRVLGEMFQFRAQTQALRSRELIGKGAIGRITRVEMVHVGLRTQEYYDERPWRGTWAGEGGGVLLNQSPHTIDRALHLAGMPCRVAAARCLTLAHRMETEDYAEALLDYPGGATGHFLVSTAEHPPVNRLVIVGEKGCILIDDEAKSARLGRLAEPLPRFLKRCREAWGKLNYEWQDLDLSPRRGEDLAHRACLRSFCLAVLGRRRAPLIDGPEGLKSLELANAITLAAFTGSAIDLPLPRREYARLFEFACRRGRGQTIQKTVAAWRRARRG